MLTCSDTSFPFLPAAHRTESLTLTINNASCQNHIKCLDCVSNDVSGLCPQNENTEWQWKSSKSAPVMVQFCELLCQDRFLNSKEIWFFFPKVLILYFSFRARRGLLAISLVWAFPCDCLDISSEHRLQRNILQVLSPCSQESKVDLAENCLVIETETAIKGGMAKLCKISGHE